MKKRTVSLVLFVMLSMNVVFADAMVSTGFSGLVAPATREPSEQVAPLDVLMNKDVKELYEHSVVYPALDDKGNIDIRALRTLFDFPMPAVDMTGITKTVQKVEVVEGNTPIDVYVYAPENLKEETSAILWTHGGGYIVGSAENDAFFTQIVRASGAIVVAPEYRLAPEHQYPAAIEDCYGTLLWMDANADQLMIDKDRVAVGGRSAGGGLTAAVSLLARDTNGPKLMYQFPIYPMLDFRNVSKSSRDMTYDYLKGKAWNREYNLSAWEYYLGMPVADIMEKGLEVSPYASPTMAESYEGLPPTYTMIGSLDPFKDETIEYISRLSNAGVDVEFELHSGGHHAFEFMPTEMGQEAFNGYFNKIVEVLSKK